jgi:hypothetical protein
MSKVAVSSAIVSSGRTEFAVFVRSVKQFLVNNVTWEGVQHELGRALH